ncbi:MAG: N-acetylglucosamine kinase [Verrucomicrobia bacterium]|nr:MAG: N-acetylglucosamine kinase [Verrucomicrobiota bacterium]
MEDLANLHLLAVEGGATRTHWRLYQVHHHKKNLIEEGLLGCGNWKSLPFAATRALLRNLPKKCDIVAVFLAGCATEEDRTAVRSLCKEIWPSAQRILVGSDRDSGYGAAFQGKDGILVIAGTGSAVTGKKGPQIETAAGWGKLLGDPGSGFALGVLALREGLRRFDLEQTVSPFLQSVRKRLGIRSMRQLTDWAEQADKADLADLAPVLFEHQKDPEIHAILWSAALMLAECCSAVAVRLKDERPSVRLAGGIFEHHPEYVRLFRKALLRHLPHAEISLSCNLGVEGAVWLALQNQTGAPPSLVSEAPPVAATEEKNPRSQGWRSFSNEKLVQLFVEEEIYVQEALRGAIRPLAQAIDIVSKRLLMGGRLFYMGAGTSGRLGILDAAELPPTFGLSPETVQGILAGGSAALIRSSEAKEDDAKLAITALRRRKLTPQDTICALSASGTTPFAWGAIREANRIGAYSILITCTPQPIPPGPNIAIQLVTGPELLAGSTRLKAGTATKIALNILSTGVMIRLGRVRDHSMAYLHPSNRKLRRRAIRILSDILRITQSEAQKKLKSADWNLKTILTKNC